MNWSVELNFVQWSHIFTYCIMMAPTAFKIFPKWGQYCPIALFIVICFDVCAWVYVCVSVWVGDRQEVAYNILPIFPLSRSAISALFQCSLARWGHWAWQRLLPLLSTRKNLPINAIVTTEWLTGCMSTEGRWKSLTHRKLLNPACPLPATVSQRVVGKGN